MSSENSELILGIDPGSIRTGFGIIRYVDHRPIYIAHGTILLDKKKPLFLRLKDLALDLALIIKKYRPTNAIIEDVFLYKNPRSALVLGQARGAVLGVCGLFEVAVHTLSSTSVKSLVCGKGQAKKFQVAKIVALELNIDVPYSEDSSDALALALAFTYNLRFHNELMISAHVNQNV